MTPGFLLCTPRGWCVQCLVPGLTQSSPQCLSGRLGIRASRGQEGKSSLSRLCPCSLSLPALLRWSCLAGLSGIRSAMDCVCWEHPGISLMDAVPSLWLPSCGPSTSQDPGQARASPVTASRTDCILLAVACFALFCCEHHGLFSILTKSPFDGEKPPSQYHWAVSPLQLWQEKASVTAMQVVVRKMVVS